MNQRYQKKNSGQTLKRVLGYVLKNYRWSFACVVVCILATVMATLYGTLFTQRLIDDYILPLTKAQKPDSLPLAKALAGLTGVYVLGIICAYSYNRIMINITQGTMRNLRIDLFTHMEFLPIRYFDTHAHGDIMSVYTNDVDTLWQLISQSIPQVINSTVTLTVKVFCNEEKSKEQFKKLNQELRESTCQANQFANIMMPVNGNLANISYVLCAVLGQFWHLEDIMD